VGSYCVWGLNCEIQVKHHPPGDLSSWGRKKGEAGIFCLESWAKGDVGKGVESNVQGGGAGVSKVRHGWRRIFLRKEEQ